MVLKLNIFLLLVFSTLTAVNSQRQCSENNARFAMDLYSILQRGNPDSNLIFSPLAIQTCAAIVYLGASGSTANEMAKDLKLVHDRNSVQESFKKVLTETEKRRSVKIANKMYVGKNIQVKPDFKKVVQDSFFSGVEVVDFSEKMKAVQVINDWVKGATNNTIESLVSQKDFSQDTELFLINAVTSEFTLPLKNAGKRGFWISQNNSKPTDMMKSLGEFKAAYNQKVGVTILELEFKSDISLLIILPSKRNGLQQLVEKLSTIDLFNISFTKDTVDVLLPKFKLAFTTDLKPVLSEMGMSYIFTVGADLSNMITGKNTYFSGGIHKSYIEVNDGVVKEVPVAFIKPSKFHADHPFVFVVKTNSTIILMGRYVSPQ